MKVSVIVCTKNRPKELMQFLASLATQSVAPDEIIIVDASDTEEAYLKIKEEFAQKPKIIYIHTKPGLTYQRNVGIKNSSGEIVFFFDDDMIVDKDFVKEIMKVFEDDSDKKIGGAMGNIVNIESCNSFKVNLRLIMQRLFLLPCSGDGGFRLSACPTFIHGATEIRNVQFLSGGLTAYRREVFRDFQFDETFPNAMFTDDEDFSYRVSQKYKNVYTPNAKIVHNPSPKGRNNRHDKAKMTVEARYYLLKKNFPHTNRYTVAFWWSIVGYLVQTITSFDKHAVRGVVRGVANLKHLANSK